MSVPKLKLKIDSQGLALPVVGSLEEFAPLLAALAAMRVYAIEPAQVRALQDPDSGTSLKRDGSNVTSVLRSLDRRDPDLVTRLGEFLNAIVPGTTRVRAVKRGTKLSLEFTEESSGNRKLQFEAFAMSDGTLYALGLLTAMMQEPPPSFMVIEEPEAHLHYGALSVILDLIRIAAQRTQILITTQSTDLLDAKWIQPDNLRIITREDGTSHVWQVSPSVATALRKHLMGAGELLRANVLDVEPLSRDGAPETAGTALG